MHSFICSIRHRAVVIAAFTPAQALEKAVPRFKLKPHQAHKITVRMMQPFPDTQEGTHG